MDPFEVRMQFLALLRKLNASSIQKVVAFALKYYPHCGEDLWDCVLEECQKGSINNRINILYFLDALCESSLLAKAHPGPNTSNSSYYVDYVARDLSIIISNVVPEGRTGLPNLMSTKQVLDDWRSKRVIDPQKVDDVLSTLVARENLPSSPPPTLPSPLASASALPGSSHTESLPRVEVFKRIEEDRERHKRLRERRWVQPISHAPPPALATFLPLTDDGDGENELTLDIEFENEWETTSDWNEDDDDAVAEENELCFPGEGEQPMDLS
ncbi:CTD kinase subunit gamma CTK3-domain-containing protein [Amylostereum chailletii]|nr:CTD kinase subunit gamma CTK3-domain-containing protein [Amylostereum chailletii]